MRRLPHFTIACGAFALAMASFVVGLEISSTTAARPQATSSQMVNRALKGDRLSFTPAATGNAVNEPTQIKAPPARAPQLLEGCEPVVSAIGQSPLARVAGRCIS